MPKNNKSVILLIEDDPDQVLLYRTKFEIDGFEVYDCRKYLEMEKILSKVAPDIILLDIILGVEDGVDILKKLNKEKWTEKVPVIVFSNLKRQDDEKLYRKLGAKDYWPKTKFLPSQVSQMIKEMLKAK